VRVVYDMSSVIWTSLLAGKDPESRTVDFEGEKVSVNGAAYGYERAINMIVAPLRQLNATPIDCVFVIEGFNAKARRLMIDRRYKAQRGKRPPEAYEEFGKLLDMLKGAFGKLGSTFVKQDNVEADDVISWIAKHTEEPITIVSRDNDLVALCGKNEYGSQVDVLIDGSLNFNKYGMFDPALITVYKALVGDSSDNISGIPKFGPKAFTDFHAEFGDAGLIEMQRLGELGSLDDIAHEVEANKMIARIYEGRDDFLRSFKLAKMYPEWVDTMQDVPEWRPSLVKGEVTDERLRPWRAQGRLVTAETWDAFVAWALPKIKARGWMGLDIETSTPDESDEWLAAQNDPGGVDTIGSELTGMSLTFGDNMQFTVYIPVDHTEVANVCKSKLRDFLAEVFNQGVRPVIHNTQFEGTVLFHEWGEAWKDNGWNGYIPNWHDTKFEASYADENDSLGLKKLAKKWFDYDQVDYKTTTTVDDVQYKMRELPAKHVFDYACDDTIVCSGLHTFFTFLLGLEHTYKVYEDIELAASYLHVQSFVHGTDISVSNLKALEKEDDEIYDGAKKTLDEFLIRSGWEGSLPPMIEGELTPAAIKSAFEVVAGAPLEKTMVRTISKLLQMVRDQGQPALADLLETDIPAANKLVASRFAAAPEFNPGSPIQMQKLLYEVMGLPVAVYNKPTANMRAEGKKQGTPKTDDLAIRYCLIAAAEELKAPIEAIRLMKMVQTRRGLYYKTYPYFVHWKTGKVHSSHNQCATNTRRASSSGPNLQQLPKHAKIEGQAAKFREVIVPHHKNAVVVSMDFASQEILLLAEWSHDPELEAVILHGKDMHSMTAVGIYSARHGVNWSYEEFKAAVGNAEHAEHKACKKYRALGKTINFSGQYRASAMKMSAILMVPENEAQVMIDAKAAAFPVSEKWAVDEMENVRHTGKVRTLSGAVRHLRDALLSPDFATAQKAERQTLSFRIQGSAAEMTKKAEGRMWEAKLEQRFDCRIIAPIHDEVVASVGIPDLLDCIRAMHACMVGPYGNMRLPITSSISFGPSFGSQIEIGNEPTEEAVNFGLEKLKEMQCQTQ